MGLSDRDYAREPSTGFTLRAPQTAVGTLLVVNVVLWLLDVVSEGALSSRMGLSSKLFREPWNVWQLVTYAFMHSPNTIWHILFNMLLLGWLFGPEMERLYGRAEFVRIYFVAIIVSGLAWVVSQNVLMPFPAGRVVGASGAVTCVWVLFALHYPKRTILLMGFIPVPMWLFGVFTLLDDVQAFVAALGGTPPSGTTAFEAHLGGAALAFAYFYGNWNFGRWLPGGGGRISASRFRVAPRAKLKLHQPTTDEPDLEEELDRILAKITAAGTDSLTPEEQRILERASARLQKRRP